MWVYYRALCIYPLLYREHAVLFLHCISSIIKSTSASPFYYSVCFFLYYFGRQYKQACVCVCLACRDSGALRDLWLEVMKTLVRYFLVYSVQWISEDLKMFFFVLFWQDLHNFNCTLFGGWSQFLGWLLCRDNGI